MTILQGMGHRNHSVTLWPNKKRSVDHAWQMLVCIYLYIMLNHHFYVSQSYIRDPRPSTDYTNMFHKYISPVCLACWLSCLRVVLPAGSSGCGQTRVHVYIYSTMNMELVEGADTYYFTCHRLRTHACMYIYKFINVAVVGSSWAQGGLVVA